MGGHQGHAKEKLGLHALIWITFFNICGGPGTMEIMSSAGPLPGLLGLLIMPLVWSIPLALITCELTTAYPHNGGYGLWVSEAFGEFWGFQESFWSWVAITVDSSLYPVLAFEIATHPFVDPADLSWSTAYAIKLLIVCVWTLPNLLGIRLFGTSVIVMGFVVLVPFIVLSIFCFADPGGDMNNITTIKENQTLLREGRSPWLALVATLFWNYSGFDCISTFAGEIENPPKTLPKVLSATVGIVVLAYFFPLVSAAYAGNPPASEWKNGDWGVIAHRQGGLALSVPIIIASFFGNMGLFMAKMFENSWQLQGMASAGSMPKLFAERHKYFGTPWYATFLALFVVAILVSFDFKFILPIDTFFFTLNAVLEILAFVQLRIIKPDLPRPYKIPLKSLFSICVLVSFPIITGIVVFCYGLFDSFLSFSIDMVGLVLGLLMYVCMKYFGRMKYISVDELAARNRSERGSSPSNAADGGEGSDDEASESAALINREDKEHAP